MPKPDLKVVDPLVELAGLPAGRKTLPCLIVRVIESVADPKRRETLRFLIDESGHSATAVSKACNLAGIQVSHSEISKHRRGGCKCPAK